MGVGEEPARLFLRGALEANSISDQVNIVGSEFRGKLFGEDEKSYIIEGSTDFGAWQEIARGAPVNGGIPFSDPSVRVKSFIEVGSSSDVGSRRVIRSRRAEAGERSSVVPSGLRLKHRRGPRR
jgi:hypothetical protein